MYIKFSNFDNLWLPILFFAWYSCLTADAKSIAPAPMPSELKGAEAEMIAVEQMDAVKESIASAWCWRMLKFHDNSITEKI